MWKNRSDTAKYLGIELNTFIQYEGEGILHIPKEAKKGSLYRPELIGFNKSKEYDKLANKITRYKSILALENIVSNESALKLYDNLYTVSDYAAKLGYTYQRLHQMLKYMEVLQIGSTKLIVDCEQNRKLGKLS